MNKAPLQFPFLIKSMIYIRDRKSAGHIRISRDSLLLPPGDLKLRLNAPLDAESRENPTFRCLY